MRKEMKKNNKMALALVVVAALAMISVAAVVVEDNDAAGSYWQMGADNSLVIDETSTANYNFVMADILTEAVCPIIITENAKYTGTLTIGVLDGLKYTSYASIKLTDASNVCLTAILVEVPGIDEPVAIFMLGNMSPDAEIADGEYVLTDGAPAGTYVLEQGQVMLGSGTAATDWSAITLSSIASMAGISAIFDATFAPFNGTITAGDLTVKAEYVLGAIVALDDDGKALLSGEATGEVDTMLPPPSATFEFPSATLSLSGEASIQLPVVFQKALEKNGVTTSPTFSTDAILVTVEANAVITAGDATPTLASIVKVAIGDVVDAFLIDSKGVAISGTPTGGPPTTDVEFNSVPFGGYTLILTTASGEAYRGTVSVSSASVGVGLNVLLSSFDPVNVTTPKFMVDVDGDVEYDKNLFIFSYAFNLTTGEVGKPAVKGVASDAVIQFEGGATVTDRVLVVMGDRTTPGKTLCYIGVADSSTTNEFVAAQTGQLTGTVTAPSVNIVYQVKDDSTILVKGEMRFLFISNAVNGTLDLATGNADLDFEGNGKVAHEIGISALGNASAILEVPGVFGSSNLSTAYYFVNEVPSATGKQSTYYFTSLDNAMKNSKVVYLEGDIVILENTTLENPDGLTVILTPGSTLKVGDADHNPTLTVPEDTELIISDPGAFEVVNGKAVFDVRPTGNDEPIADIRIDGDKTTYTDIATALDEAKSGDVLELQRNAELKRDASVKAGVELKDSIGSILTIPVGKTLTVDGQLTTEIGMEIYGTLRVNKDADFDGANVILDGTIDVTANGTVSFVNTILTGSGGILRVDGGEVDVSSGSGITVAELILVKGTLTVDSTSSLTVTENLEIGKQPTVSTENKNEATVTGKITLSVVAVGTVYGQKDFTANIQAIAANVIVSVKYMIDGVLYVTKYCDSTSGEEIEMLYEDQLLDIVILDWNNDQAFRGLWLYDSSPVLIGATGWGTVYAKWEPKMYNVILSYTPGVDWIVNVPGVMDDKVSGTIQVAYGKEITVKAVLQPGYEGTPSVTANGKAYDGKAWKVTEDVKFAVTDGSVKVAGSDKGGDDGLTLIEILLIIIVIIIAIIAIIIAIRLLRS